MILKNARVISPANNLDAVVDIKIQKGIIVKISPNMIEGGMDFSRMIITPGLIDMHCHLREPGFEYKETIETGIESALNGGFTGICPMANTKPVIDNPDVLNYTKEKASGINFYPVSAITKNIDGEEIVDFEAMKAAGAIAFSDDGKPLSNMALYEKALQSGNLIMSHAEDSSLGTNPLSEAVAVKKELELLRFAGGKIHFAHISTKKAINLIRQAKYEGLKVTCETAPHYFSFTKENETADGRFKMNPPLRTKDDLAAVIEGLKDGTIDCIATDHAPHCMTEKTNPFALAPFGVVGLETALGAALTNLVDKGHLSINQIIQKMSVNPAKILGLQEQGRIEVGQKANLTIIDPNIEYKVKAKDFKTMCKISPFEGAILKGKALTVVINGEIKKWE
ncbi:MAG: dihydroorotase [bacterium]